MGSALRTPVRAAATMAVAASLALPSGCAEPDYPAEALDATYVGELVGTDDVVAITVAGSEVVVYVCGGPQTFRERSRWFRGELPRDGSRDIELTAADGTTGVLRLSLGSATGFVGAEALALSASRTASGTIAGLYAIVDAGCRTGVVVRQDPGEPPSVQGTWCSEQGISAQVTPILPVEIVDGGLRVAVDPGGQGFSRELLVVPLDPRGLD